MLMGSCIGHVELLERRRAAIVRSRSRNRERREQTLSRFRFPVTAFRMLLSRRVLSLRQRLCGASTG